VQQSERRGYHLSQPSQDGGTSVAPSRVAEESQRVGQLPSYFVSGSDLEMGASLANATTWVNTKGTDAIQDVFSTELGLDICGSINLKFAGAGHRLVRAHHDAAEWMPGSEQMANVELPPDGDGTFELHPAYQRHTFALPGSLDVTSTTLVPRGKDEDPPAVCIHVAITNRSAAPRALNVYAFAALRGGTPTDVTASYDPGLRALVARNAGQPDWVRLFGTTAPRARYGTTFDVTQVYEPTHVYPLKNDCTAHGDVLGALQVECAVEPGHTWTTSFLLAHSAHGETPAREAYAGCVDVPARLQECAATLFERLNQAQVMSPDPVINDGVLWAKANMLRVMASYPQGRAFTNEPGVSSNVVGRDVAWFVYGCDHFQPDFCRDLLLSFAKRQYANGKIPEYYSALTGKVEDYGLNINDDTPLFILAVNHHWRSTGNRQFLQEVYPAVAKAARYIVSQEDQRGLVVCTAKGQNVWGIASWRNVIPNYTLSGAVTEINAECAAALRATAHLAENMGQPDGEVREFRLAYEQLQQAMNQHLLNPINGLYYLNIDNEGNPHTDVTGDEVFPVMFRVAAEDVAFRIISRLNSPDFWTEGGIRTVSRQSPQYHPFADVGLRGGVWPGLTWWYAFAAARYHPEFMVEALRASFAHYNRAPRHNNTVPGQFSEWFDGESLVNRGMRLSPWEPPRFLWAAIEGMCGVVLRPDVLTVKPVIPAIWSWVALRRLPYQGREVAFFAARAPDDGFRIYANEQIESDHPREVFDADVTDEVRIFNQHARLLALARPGEWLIAVGNPLDRLVVVPLDLSALLDQSTTYQTSLYHSERQQWLEGAGSTSQDLAQLALQIDAGGFRILRIRGNLTP